MSLDDAEMARKLRKASQMLLVQRHQTPGVKGWELRKTLGKEYRGILEVLNIELEKLDLELKTVSEEGEMSADPSQEEFDRARFFVVSRHPPDSADSMPGGWRIDDVAILSATLAYTVSRQGKAPRREVERLLREKFPRWKVDVTLARFIRRGYLVQDKEDTLYVGWRTMAEIDRKTLLNLILSAPTPKEQT